MKSIHPFILSVIKGNNDGRFFHFMLKIFRFPISKGSASHYFYQADQDK